MLSISAQSDTERPNILLLVAEDLSPRIGAYGDTLARTPHLDGLAAGGLRYTQVFTTAGVCAPSRAALVTGMHQNVLGAQHMRSTTFEHGKYYAVPPAQVKAFPELLRAAGYFTFTDDKLDYQFSATRANSGPSTIWSAEGRKAHWRQREQGQPFFGMINFFVTHESGLFSPLGKRPVSLTHFVLQGARALQFGRGPGQLKPETQSIVLPPYYPDLPSVRQTIARHYGNIQFMDQQVGAIFEALREDGLAENTIIIWTTDHGDGLPRAKRELYHSGIHVPMIVYLPERWRPSHLQSGTAVDRLVSFVDLAPSLLALAGIEAPAHLPGTNLFDPQSRPRSYVYAARDRIDEVDDRQRAVFDGRYKYIRSWYPDLPGGHRLAFRDNIKMVRDMQQLAVAGRLTAAQQKWFEGNGKEQLYDLASDPHEINNLAASPAHATIRRNLSGVLEQWLNENNDIVPLPERDMRANLLCEGQRCKTSPPTLSLQQDVLTITASQTHDSLEYRIDNDDWQLYTGPVRVEGGREFSARAVRYGWLPSQIVALPHGAGE